MPEKVHTHFDEPDAKENQSTNEPLKEPEPQPDNTKASKKKEKKEKKQKQDNKEFRESSKKRKREDNVADDRPPRTSDKHEHEGTNTNSDANVNNPVDESKNSDRKKTKKQKNSDQQHERLQQQQQQRYRQSTSLKEKAKTLLPIRKNLPIFPHINEIRDQLRQNDVMLLIGETGSGKSTQIPQFLVDEFWCRPRSAKVTQEYNSEDQSNGDDEKKQKEITVGGCIAITQPRRVAAISLARRVAEEMGTPLGNSSPASKVGYSVRFDTSTSPNTRIKFLTEGMLLQEMLNDPWLTRYSAVVVDEVHERGVNVDLVLGFLRNLVFGKKEGRGGVPLKVAVMSATVDMESLLGFFTEGLQGRTEVGSERTDNNTTEKQETGPESNGISGHAEIATCHVKGRQFPVKTIYSPEPVHDFVDASLKIIFQIHYKEPMPGDILVFLTGQETVEALENLVNEYSMGMDPALPKIQVLPLFAALPQAAQQRVFLPAPPRTRKVVLATNIAETSVTVSGVRYVVDCGKAKVKQFRSRLGLDSLLVKPISKSAAIQRKGRAGREAPGKCYRLYTEKDYLALDDTNTPEILRCDLSQALLNLKARGVDDIMGFPFLTRPPREALEKALLQLLNIDALDETGRISAVGSHIAKLPLTPTLGRVLLAAAENGSGCLSDVIDIISCLSVENMFLNTSSEEKKEEAERARNDLYRREGDHLTMLATVQAYAAENTDRKAWAERHMVSHRAMQSVMVSTYPLTTIIQDSKIN